MTAAHREMAAGSRRAAFALALLAAAFTPALAQAAPGDLDRSFGDRGTTVTQLCDHPRFGQVVIDRHGRIVFAGGDNNQTEFCLARFHRNGSLDHSFSGDGKVKTDFGPGKHSSAARSVAIDSRGRIVAAGSYGPTEREPKGFALARYKPNGHLDDSFSGNGKTTTPFAGFSVASSVAIDSHDRIAAAGRSNQDFALARYRRNGKLDPLFGPAGKVTTDFGGKDAALSVAIDPHGRIVAGGNAAAAFALARYKRNGSLDPSFGGDGQVTTQFGDFSLANSIAIDFRGRIVAAGVSGPNDDMDDFALARYWRNGNLDDSFSGNGKVTTAFQDRYGASAVAIDSRRRIVAGGGAFDLARYRPSGRLDRSFGTRGKVTSRKLAFAFLNSVAIDPRDRIVAAGWHSHLHLARFIGYRER